MSEQIETNSSNSGFIFQDQLNVKEQRESDLKNSHLSQQLNPFNDYVPPLHKASQPKPNRSPAHNIYSEVTSDPKNGQFLQQSRSLANNTNTLKRATFNSFSQNDAFVKVNSDDEYENTENRTPPLYENEIHQMQGKPQSKTQQIFHALERPQYEPNQIGYDQFGM